MSSQNCFRRRMAPSTSEYFSQEIPRTSWTVFEAISHRSTHMYGLKPNATPLLPLNTLVMSMVRRCCSIVVFKKFSDGGGMRPRLKGATVTRWTSIFSLNHQLATNNTTASPTSYSLIEADRCALAFLAQHRRRFLRFKSC